MVGSSVKLRMKRVGRQVKGTRATIVCLVLAGAVALAVAQFGGRRAPLSSSRTAVIAGGGAMCDSDVAYVRGRLRIGDRSPVALYGRIGAGPASQQANYRGHAILVERPIVGKVTYFRGTGPSSITLDTQIALEHNRFVIFPELSFPAAAGSTWLMFGRFEPSGEFRPSCQSTSESPASVLSHEMLSSAKTLPLTRTQIADLIANGLPPGGEGAYGVKVTPSKNLNPPSS